MKIKIFSILLFSVFVFSTLVSADVISVNSGGDTGLIINPDQYIEGFFMAGNRFPVATNVILSSSSGTNTTYENLSVSFTISDADNNPVTNITDWRLNSSSIAGLNFAFDKRVFSTDTGDIRDYSTNLNPGTLGGGTSANSPTWISNGKIGGAYEFDGANDFIEVTHHTSLTPTTNLTVSAWINANEWEANYWEGVIVSKNDWASGANGYVLRTGDSGKLSFNIGDGSDWYDSVTTSIMSTSTWYHVVGVFNGTACITYINGVERDVEAFSSITINPSSYNLNVGRGNYDTPNRLFNGSIDEVQIYNRSLSAQQISALYSAGNIGNHSKLLVSQETSKGDVWQVAVTPNDVFDDGTTVLSNNLTIVDASPDDPTSVTLLSLNARNESDTDLNCSAFVSDIDNSDLTVYVNWLKDDISQYNYSFASQTNGTTFSTTLDNNNLTLTDVWKCSVLSSDGNSNSSWIDSNELTIIDITSPNITIISPNSSMNYTTLEINFNISIQENENISQCFYSLNDTANVTMTELNNSYFWYAPDNLIPGTHNVTFYCNDTSNNWGINQTNFTILDEAAISISLSPSLAWNVNWTLAYLPTDDLDATGNNEDGATEYYINVSTENVGVDLYVKADDNLTTAGLDVLVLGNETYVVNKTNNTVPDLNRLTMTTSYYLISGSLTNASVVYMKFYLDAPASQPAGTYLNNLDFKAVREGAYP